MLTFKRSWKYHIKYIAKGVGIHPLGKLVVICEIIYTIENKGNEMKIVGRIHETILKKNRLLKNFPIFILEKGIWRIELLVQIGSRF